MRNLKWLPALLALTVGLAAAANAAPRPVRSLPQAPPPEDRPLNLLPSDPGATTEQLVQAALRMPAAQLAMQELQELGYTRAAAADQGRVGEGLTCVTLAYTDPAHPTYAPLVIVISDTHGAPARTWVMTAEFDVDVATRQVQIVTDPSPGTESIVTTNDMRSTQPGNYIVSTDGASRGSVIRYLECAIVGCGAGAGVCNIVGMLVGPLAPPTIAGCDIAACATVAYICLW